MKNLNKFAAQQLSKNQMNNVKGGDGAFDDCGKLFYCTWEGGSNYVCEKNRHELDILSRYLEVTCVEV